MKTKNILKIGVLSIILLSLFISPVSKLNIFEAKAASECEEADADNICIVKGRRMPDCKDLEGDYVESPLSCAGAGGGKNQCCIPNPEPGTVQVGQHALHTVIIKETSGEVICEGVGTWGVEIWEKTWWEHYFCVIQKSIIEGLGKMFAAMINTQVKMIIWAFNPATYGGFVKNSAVQEVWKFIRDLINLVLVLALVFIAITTILGMKKYSWQQTLWKLVVVALLVNFSLVMAGMILDVSHFLAYTFLNLAKTDSASIADSMIKSFETKTLTSGKEYELSGVSSVTKATTTGWGLSWGNFFIASFGLILIGLFALIALLAVFIAMIVRSFIIITLLCVTPVAFAAWIFPDTEKFWKMWWDQFIKWCTFPIIFGVMLWIGVSVVDNLGNLGSSANLGMIPFIIRMFLFSMFLVGGLIFSIQGGGAVAQTVTKQAGKLGLAAGAFVGYKALKGAAGSETYRKAQEKLEKSGLRPLHDLGVWMGRQPEKIRAAELKQIEEDYKKRSEDQIRYDMEMHKNDKARVAAGLNQLIERKKINYDKDSEFVNIARNHPALNVPELKKAHPGLYTDYFTTPVDMQKAIEQAQLKAPFAIPLDKAKKLAKIDLIAERVKGAGSEAIKSGNWNDILERLEKKGILENKGTEYTDHFFRSLWDANVPSGSYAAMLGPMDLGKQRKWAQEFFEYVKRRNKGDATAAIADLKKRRFDKNRFMNELLPF